MERDGLGFGRVGLLVGLGGVILMVAVAWYWQPWQKLGFGPGDLALPVLDVGHARQIQISAGDGGRLTVIDTQKVQITLEVPPGALSEDAIVQLIPFFPNPQAAYPTSGVMVSPGQLAFTKPATLTFDIGGTRTQSDAPGNSTARQVRLTGPSQVLLFDATANTLTPTLVVRPAEIATVIPARVVSGGAYVWSITPADAVTNARAALTAKQVHPLVALEAGSRILASQKLLSGREAAQVTRAVKGTLAAEQPSGPEFFAAAALQKQHGVGQARHLITPAYAADLGRGYFETRCQDRTLALNEYLTASHTAQLLGYEDLGEACFTTTTTIVAQDAEALLASQHPDPIQLLIQLQRVQIVGLDEDSTLDDRLYDRARTTVTEDGRRVLADPDATALDIALALQRIQNIGRGEDPSVEKGLSAKLEALGTVTLPPPDVAAEHPELIPGFDSSVIALPLAQLLGLQSFDEAGIRVFTDAWVAREGELKVFAEAVCSLTVAFEVTLLPQCATVKSDLTHAFDTLARAGYRAAAQIGGIQGQEFEEPASENDAITFECHGLSDAERRQLGCPDEGTESTTQEDE